MAGEFRGKPVAKSFGAKPAGRGFAAKGAGPVKPSARFGARLDGKTEKDRRPFKKDGAAALGGGEEELYEAVGGGSEAAGGCCAEGGWVYEVSAAGAGGSGAAGGEGAGWDCRRSGGSAKERATKSFEKRPYTPRSPYTPRGEEGGERATFKPRSYESGSGEGGVWSEAAVWEAGC